MISNLLIEDIVRKTLLEDMPTGRDLTSDILFSGEHTARASIVTKQPGVLCGLIAGLSAFSLTDPDFSFDIRAQDGDLLQDGDMIAVIEGPAQALLSAERTALNFMMHLSGIATMTMAFADECEGTKAKITCTRKTLPGLRALQKYAVRVGGGFNHRHGLDDAILIKDNHIAVAGSISDALSMVKERAGHMVKIEIEVDTLEQLDEVLKSGQADVVLLDNFDLKDLQEGVKRVNGALITEASGGVSLSNVRSIAETGVDYISAGALTHSAPSLNLGLDIDI